MAGTVPWARRRGAGRALVTAVAATACVAGAIRLSVQTEPGNTTALQLYHDCGFIPVDDVLILSLDLTASNTRWWAGTRQPRCGT